MVGLFCVMQIYVGPLLVGLGAIFTLIVTAQISSRYPMVAMVMVIEGFASIGFTVWGFQAAQNLRALRPGAVAEVKDLLRARLGWSFLAVFFPAITEIPSAIFPGAIKDLVVTLVGFAIWYSYFSVSRRVKASFGN